MGQMHALVDIPGTPFAVGMARRIVEALLSAWELTEISDDAQLVVTELMGNAIDHAPGAASYELELVRRSDGVCIYLADGSSVRPFIAHLAQESRRGRGMRLVEALSSSWGAEDHHGGKRVWADLLLTTATA
ncbi:MAG TPA: ATP-binding protein [Jatrophihabitantaceae bacterium]|jgi:anti-sigma regulatory factor (Ser/Thr protein kinase)|nr:ATP-binding protein [Jatrophihabitantaceae bacterium]